MKRFSGLVVFMMVFILAAGVGLSEEKRLPLVTYKERMGLRGPVKEVVFWGIGFGRKEKQTFSREGLITTEVITTNDTTVSRYDHLERKIAEGILKAESKIVTLLEETVYDDEKKLYLSKSEELDFMGNIHYKVHEGVLNEQLKKEKGTLGFKANIAGYEEYTYSSEYYAYDLKGNLLKVESGSFIYEYKYNDNNWKTSSKLAFRETNGAGLIVEEIIFYNENGLVEKVRTNGYSNGKITKTTDVDYYGYELDHYHNWTHRKVKKSDGKTWVETRTITYWE